MCDFPVSFLESHLIERRLVRCDRLRIFQKRPFSCKQSQALMDHLSPDVPYLLDCEPKYVYPSSIHTEPFQSSPPFHGGNKQVLGIISTFDTAYEDMTPR
jgi:hypothetical protein